MRLCVALLLLFVFFVPNAYAQKKHTIDSLEKVIAKAPADTHKVTLLNKLGYEYFLSKPKKAPKYFEEARKLAEALNYKTGSAYSYYNLSLVYSATGDKDKSLYYKNLFNATKEKIEDSKQITTLSNEITDKNKELEGKIKDLSAREKDLLEQEGELRMLDTVLNRTQREKEGLSKELNMRKLELQIKENQIMIKEQDRQIELGQEKALRNLFIAGFIIAGLVAFFIYRGSQQRQKAAKDLAEKNAIIASEKERSDALLLNILPAETADELKKYGKASPRYYPEVTVLFTDFKNFTRFAEKYTPEELVNEIDFCFRKFDEITASYGLEKIKTIGDAYMCASGVPVQNSNDTAAVIEAAIEIRDFMAETRKQRQKAGGDYWEIRIGIHTGPIVAGIVGSRKFAYDIWGDAVNTAARLESSGEAGKINISEATHEMVKSKFKSQFRGKIEAKNKGEIAMYFVEDKV